MPGIAFESESTNLGPWNLVGKSTERRRNAWISSRQAIRMPFVIISAQNETP